LCQPINLRIQKNAKEFAINLFIAHAEFRMSSARSLGMDRFYGRSEADKASQMVIILACTGICSDASPNG
jgi:hypothetical protein